jgi:hypothetical protein
MCYCFHSFKDLWPYLSAIHSGPVTQVSKRTAKVQAFINSVQIFLPFSEDFASANPTRKLVEELYFFEVGCKGRAICLFNQIFLSPSVSPKHPQLV